MERPHFCTKHQIEYSFWTGCDYCLAERTLRNEQMDKDKFNDAVDKVTHTSGATSSACHDYAQIPISALDALAARFEYGEKKHGRDNWRKGLHDKTYVVERLNHVIRHAKLLADKLMGLAQWDEDDDAGAILWGGAFAAEACLLHKPKAEEPTTSLEIVIGDLFMFIKPWESQVVYRVDCIDGDALCPIGVNRIEIPRGSCICGQWFTEEYLKRHFVRLGELKGNASNSGT